MRGERTLATVSHEMLALAAVSDLATHAQDVRGALRVDPDRDAYATKIAYAAFSMMVESRTAVADIPPIRIATERGDVSIGAQAEARTIEVDWYELLRATAGRRSADQIRELFAPADASPYLTVISPCPLPVEHIDA
jgi:hypothetical protein